MAEPFRILVTGSRDWPGESLITGALLHEVSRRPRSDTITVVHGGAPGADEMAGRVAAHYGWQVEVHAADWDRYGKSAGHRRNAEMVALGADVCLCFVAPCSSITCQSRAWPHGSHGASNCADLAEKAGIPVRRFKADGTDSRYEDWVTDPDPDAIPPGAWEN